LRHKDDRSAFHAGNVGSNPAGDVATPLATGGDRSEHRGGPAGRFPIRRS